MLVHSSFSERSSRSTPEIYLLRHGETEGSLSGSHTGISDIPLTQHGRQLPTLLERELATRNFAADWNSTRLCDSSSSDYVGDEKRASLARRLYDERAARAVAIN